MLFQTCMDFYIGAQTAMVTVWYCYKEKSSIMFFQNIFFCVICMWIINDMLIKLLNKFSCIPLKCVNVNPDIQAGCCCFYILIIKYFFSRGPTVCECVSAAWEVLTAWVSHNTWTPGSVILTPALVLSLPRITSQFCPASKHVSVVSITTACWK